MKNEIKILTKTLKEIMGDYCTDVFTIGSCDYHVQGCLLTHCYYDWDNDKFIFTSGDMINDKDAEEILLSDNDIINVLKEIIYCYE